MNSAIPGSREEIGYEKFKKEKSERLDNFYEEVLKIHNRNSYSKKDDLEVSKIQKGSHDQYNYCAMFMVRVAENLKKQQKQSRFSSDYVLQILSDFEEKGFELDYRFKYVELALLYAIDIPSVEIVEKMLTIIRNLDLNSSSGQHLCAILSHVFECEHNDRKNRDEYYKIVTKIFNLLNKEVKKRLYGCCSGKVSTIAQQRNVRDDTNDEEPILDWLNKEIREYLCDYFNSRTFNFNLLDEEIKEWVHDSAKVGTIVQQRNGRDDDINDKKCILIDDENEDIKTDCISDRNVLSFNISLSAISNVIKREQQRHERERVSTSTITQQGKGRDDTNNDEEIIIINDETEDVKIEQQRHGRGGGVSTITQQRKGRDDINDKELIVIDDDETEDIKTEVSERRGKVAQEKQGRYCIDGANISFSIPLAYIQGCIDDGNMSLNIPPSYIQGVITGGDLGRLNPNKSGSDEVKVLPFLAASTSEDDAHDNQNNVECKDLVRKIASKNEHNDNCEATVIPSLASSSSENQDIDMKEENEGFASYSSSGSYVDYVSNSPSCNASDDVCAANISPTSNVVSGPVEDEDTVYATSSNYGESAESQIEHSVSGAPKGAQKERNRDCVILLYDLFSDKNGERDTHGRKRADNNIIPEEGQNNRRRLRVSLPSNKESTVSYSSSCEPRVLASCSSGYLDSAYVDQYHINSSPTSGVVFGSVEDEDTVHSTDQNCKQSSEKQVVGPEVGQGEIRKTRKRKTKDPVYVCRPQEHIVLLNLLEDTKWQRNNHSRRREKEVKSYRNFVFEIGRDNQGTGNSRFAIMSEEGKRFLLCKTRKGAEKRKCELKNIDIGISEEVPNLICETQVSSGFGCQCGY